MPTLDEPALRDLMHHATADLHAPQAPTRIGMTGPRSRAPGVLVALGASGVVAAAAVGFVVAGPGSAPVAPTTTAAHPASIGATPAQRVLYRLASVSERAPRGPASSVAIGTEAAGAVRTSFTATQLATLPTQPTRLRAALIVEAGRVKAAAAEEAAQAETYDAVASAVQKVLALSREIAAESPSEEVFTQAAGVLADARTTPTVRAAVYEVLATTPGVTVTGVTITTSGDGSRPGLTDPALSSNGMDGSDVEIRALVTATSPSIVVSRTTGAVIKLSLPMLTGGPGGRLPPLVTHSR